MIRKITIYDETNDIPVRIKLDDDTEFLQVWGKKIGKKCSIFVEIIKIIKEK